MLSDFARAIAHAEGFGVADAIPTLAHNPGDLVLGDKGHGTLGSEKITVFADNATGWAALEHQLKLIKDGKSHVYNSNMTLYEMSKHWTNTQQNEWVNNICDWFCSNGKVVTGATQIKDLFS